MTTFREAQKGEQRQAKKRRCFFVSVATFALATLGACATITVQTTTPEVFAGEQKLSQDFSLKGRISVRVSDKIDSGQIRWSRTAEEERIGLYSPLGTQVAELISDRRARVVTLRQGNETRLATSVAELTQSLFGVPLDLDRMSEWAQGYGLRDNAATDQTFANGDVWRVTAERYQASGDYRFASRVTATSGDMVVKLVVDEWTAK